MATVTDGKSQTTTYAYDDLDRITSITYHDTSTITYAYDENGNQTSRVDATGTTANTYDALNRLSSEAKQSQTISYAYWGNDLLKELTDSSGTTSYAYDAANRLTTITEPTSPGNRSITISYPSETSSTITYPNLATLAMTDDTAGRLLTIVGKDGAGTPRSSLTYTYIDTANNNDTSIRRSVLDNLTNQKTFYSYDTVGRLTQAETRASGGTGTLVSDYQYGYDANGNRTSEQVTRNGTTNSASYSYGDANELTSTGYTTDANGNLTAAPSRGVDITSPGVALAYTAKDQTSSITPSGGSATNMSYAGPGQAERTAAGSESFIHDQLGLNRRTGSSATSYFTRTSDGIVLGQRTPTGNHYFLTDALNSIVAITDAAGNQVATYAYDASGKVVAETPNAPFNPWRFANYYYEGSATKVYKVGERYYDPATGRWTQTDPVNQPLDERGWNRYPYAGGDPINFTDPTGLFSLRCVLGAIGGIGVAIVGVSIGVVTVAHGLRLAISSVRFGPFAPFVAAVGVKMALSGIAVGSASVVIGRRIIREAC